MLTLAYYNRFQSFGFEISCLITTPDDQGFYRSIDAKLMLSFQ